MIVKVAFRSRPYPGERANGDGVLVGEGFVAVIDALGHGERAQAARLVAEEALGKGGTSVQALFDAVHGALRGSRGIAMAVVRHTADGELEAAGVGNVAVRAVFGATLPFVPTPGIVGAQFRGLRISRGRVSVGARLLLHTDGISSRFDEALAQLPDADEACEQILQRHGSVRDDATIAFISFVPPP
jgi:negative regulator of sigma-B (phosphoserine phosphatase)